MPKTAWTDGEDLIIRLYIQPKSSRDQMVGLHGDELKIAITAPPVDGKANSYLSKYLSKQFKVSKGSIIIEKGETSRHKQVRILSPNIVPLSVKAIL